MNFKLILILIFIGSFSFNGNCHSLSFNDSTNRKIFPNTYGDKKWKVLFGLDARRSYFKDQKVKINGLRLGAQYKGVHRFGLGFYAIGESFIIKNINVDQADAINPTTIRVNVGFSTLFYERVFYKVPKWEVALPIYLGSGQLKTEYINNLGNYKPLSKTPFSVLGLGVSVKYYILSWLAPRIMIGHRFTYNTVPEIRTAFNKPFYTIGLSISLGELYKSVFKKDKE